MSAKSKGLGLGRGLDALLSASERTDSALLTLPIHALRAGVYQPRSHMDETALEELAASIRAQGVIQPVVVREVGLGEYELIAGERRWRAARLAGLQEIPAVVRSVGDEVTLAMALIENIQREQLDPLEEAQGIQRLIDEFGLTHERVGEMLGKSRSAVSNLLRLLSLPEPVQQLLHQRKLDMGHVRALLALPVLMQLDMAVQAAAQAWSVRETERQVQSVLARESEGVEHASRVSKITSESDLDVARLAEDLGLRLNAEVSIRHGKKGKGCLTIHYSSLEQLDDILAIMNKKV